MAAYRDSADWLRDGVRSGHLIADTHEELLALAGQLELAERYFQPHAVLPHYQLPAAFHDAADVLGILFLERNAFKEMTERVTQRRQSSQWEKRKRSPMTPSIPLKKQTTKSKPIQPLLL